MVYQGEVLSLFDHYHKFTVEEVIDQHELRCNEPEPDLDPVTNLETETSKQLRFESYDKYEFDDFGLSRLVVESLLSPSLVERIITRFGNDKDFDTYSGQILLSWRWILATHQYNVTLLALKRDTTISLLTPIREKM